MKSDPKSLRLASSKRIDEPAETAGGGTRRIITSATLTGVWGCHRSGRLRQGAFCYHSTAIRIGSRTTKGRIGGDDMKKNLLKCSIAFAGMLVFSVSVL